LTGWNAGIAETMLQQQRIMLRLQNIGG